MNSQLLTRSSPFEPEVLRKTLPPFDFAAPMPRDALFQAYRSYYHLTFEQQWPDLKVNAGQVRAGGFDIVVQTFQPPQARGTVFVLHGYYDHAGIFNHLIEALLAQGFAVLIFDLPGHGLSSGDRAVIDSFRQYQVVLQKMVMLARGQLPRPWHLVGQSTGAAIASDYLLSHSSTADKLPFTSAVLLAPLVRPVNWGFNRFQHSLIAPWRDYIPRKYVASSSDPAYLQFAMADPLQPHLLSSRWVGALRKWVPYIERHEPMRFPLLIIQGEADRTVDWRHNTAVLRSKFRPSEVQCIPRMRHHVVKEAAGFREQVFSRMNRFLIRATESARDNSRAG